MSWSRPLIGRSLPSSNRLRSKRISHNTEKPRHIERGWPGERDHPEPAIDRTTVTRSGLADSTPATQGMYSMIVFRCDSPVDDSRLGPSLALAINMSRCLTRSPNPGRYTEADHPFASRGRLKLDQAPPLGDRCHRHGLCRPGLLDRVRVLPAAGGQGLRSRHGLWRAGLRAASGRARRRHGAAKCSLHAEPEPVDLVNIDLGWTKQDKALAAALKWLARAEDHHADQAALRGPRHAPAQEEAAQARAFDARREPRDHAAGARCDR